LVCVWDEEKGTIKFRLDGEKAPKTEKRSLRDISPLSEVSAETLLAWLGLLHSCVVFTSWCGGWVAPNPQLGEDGPPRLHGSPGLPAAGHGIPLELA